MYKNINYIKSDLIQAKLLSSNVNFTYVTWFIYFLRFRTCRVHSFIRFRSGNRIIANIAKLYLDRFLIQVGRSTVIGKFFWLPHPRCIILSDEVIIGEHVHIAQYVTIGGNYKKTKINSKGGLQKLPIIGNSVSVGPGAVLGGPINIGNQVIIGANAVVTHDVPNNSIVYGQNQISSRKITIPKEGGIFEYIRKL